MSDQRNVSSRLPPSPTRRRAPGLTTLGAHSAALRKVGPLATRRPSGPSLTTSAQKAQRTSKTSHKLVVLPSAPQTRPLPDDVDDFLGYETDKGIREYKSEAERMSKELRKQAGFKRITAYCVAESFKMKHLATFLKREHNVAPRVFDEALYAVPNIPLDSALPTSRLMSSASL